MCAHIFYVTCISARYTLRTRARVSSPLENQTKQRTSTTREYHITHTPTTCTVGETMRYSGALTHIRRSIHSVIQCIYPHHHERSSHSAHTHTHTRASAIKCGWNVYAKQHTKTFPYQTEKPLPMDPDQGTLLRYMCCVIRPYGVCGKNIPSSVFSMQLNVVLF